MKNLIWHFYNKTGFPEKFREDGPASQPPESTSQRPPDRQEPALWSKFFSGILIPVAFAAWQNGGASFLQLAGRLLGSNSLALTETRKAHYGEAITFPSANCLEKNPEENNFFFAEASSAQSGAQKTRAPSQLQVQALTRLLGRSSLAGGWVLAGALGSGIFSPCHGAAFWLPRGL